MRSRIYMIASVIGPLCALAVVLGILQMVWHLITAAFF